MAILPILSPFSQKFSYFDCKLNIQKTNHSFHLSHKLIYSDRNCRGSNNKVFYWLYISFCTLFESILCYIEFDTYRPARHRRRRRRHCFCGKNSSSRCDVVLIFCMCDKAFIIVDRKTSRISSSVPLTKHDLNYQ